MKQINIHQLKYGIETDDLNLIIETIKANDKVLNVNLFGSRAKGNYKQNSDLDLALITNNLTLDELLEIKINLNNLMLPFKIDIIDFNKISNNDLIEHIKKFGIVIG